MISNRKLNDSERQLRVMLLLNRQTIFHKLAASLVSFSPSADSTLAAWATYHGIWCKPSIRKRMRIPKAYHIIRHGIFRRPRRLAWRAYELRRHGYSDLRIAVELGIGMFGDNDGLRERYMKTTIDYDGGSDSTWQSSFEVKSVAEMIGFVLMYLCRRSKACPYKAMLPETKVRV